MEAVKCILEKKNRSSVSFSLLCFETFSFDVISQTKKGGADFVQSVVCIESIWYSILDFALPFESFGLGCGFYFAFFKLSSIAEWGNFQAG